MFWDFYVGNDNMSKIWDLKENENGEPLFVKIHNFLSHIWSSLVLGLEWTRFTCRSTWHQRTAWWACEPNTSWCRCTSPPYSLRRQRRRWVAVKGRGSQDVLGSGTHSEVGWLQVPGCSLKPKGDDETRNASNQRHEKWRSCALTCPGLEGDPVRKLTRLWFLGYSCECCGTETTWGECFAAWKQTRSGLSHN